MSKPRRRVFNPQPEVNLRKLPRFPDCPGCGKKSFPSKKIAKKVCRRVHPEERMNVYSCEAEVAFAWERWHYGHLQPGDRSYREDNIA